MFPKPAQNATIGTYNLFLEITTKELKSKKYTKLNHNAPPPPTMQVLMKQLLQPCPGNVEFNMNLGQNLKNTLRKKLQEL